MSNFILRWHILTLPTYMRFVFSTENTQLSNHLTLTNAHLIYEWSHTDLSKDIYFLSERGFVSSSQGTYFVKHHLDSHRYYDSTNLLTPLYINPIIEKKLYSSLYRNS